MPERVAKTDAFEKIKETIGSGPFKFVKDEWVPGNKVVFVKNTDYVPRKEPPSWASGGKVVKVDRVEWIYIPDSATAAAALNAGEVDWWQMVPPDLVPLLTKNKDIKVENTDPMGSMGMIRFNQLHPPFNNPEDAPGGALSRQPAGLRARHRRRSQERQALSVVLHLRLAGRKQGRLGSADRQARSRQGQAADQGGRLQGREDRRALGHRPADRAQPGLDHASRCCKSAGLNAELAANDWGTLISRRAVKEPIEKGGWNIFHTWLVGPDMANPAINYPLRGIGEKSWFGWPTDPKMEELRNAWFDATDPGVQKKLIDDMQRHGWESVPFIPTAQFIIPTAYRTQHLGPDDLADRLPLERREEIARAQC